MFETYKDGKLGDERLLKILNKNRQYCLLLQKENRIRGKK